MFKEARILHPGWAARGATATAQKQSRKILAPKKLFQLCNISFR